MMYGWVPSYGFRKVDFSTLDDGVGSPIPMRSSREILPIA
jgi:hypothetical protein